jgi:hypothetical protein
VIVHGTRGPSTQAGSEYPVHERVDVSAAGEETTFWWILVIRNGESSSEHEAYWCNCSRDTLQITTDHLESGWLRGVSIMKLRTLFLCHRVRRSGGSVIPANAEPIIVATIIAKFF